MQSVAQISQSSFPGDLMEQHTSDRVLWVGSLNLG